MFRNVPPIALLLVCASLPSCGGGDDSSPPPTTSPTPTNVGGISGLPIVFYVTDNGVTTVYQGDPAAIELTSHREITIQIGSPVDAIPNFTWTGG